MGHASVASILAPLAALVPEHVGIVKTFDDPSSGVDVDGSESG